MLGGCCLGPCSHKPHATRVRSPKISPIQRPSKPHDNKKIKLSPAFMALQPIVSKLLALQQRSSDNAIIAPNHFDYRLRISLKIYTTSDLSNALILSYKPWLNPGALGTWRSNGSG